MVSVSAFVLQSLPAHMCQPRPPDDAHAGKGVGPQELRAATLPCAASVLCVDIGTKEVLAWQCTGGLHRVLLLS